MVDGANLSTGQSHRYCLRALGGLLSVTLAWHDYPAALPAARALVNDLDLSVRAAGLNGFPLLVSTHTLSVSTAMHGPCVAIAILSDPSDLAGTTDRHAGSSRHACVEAVLVLG